MKLTEQEEIELLAEKILIHIDQVSAAMKGPRFAFIELQKEIEDLIKASNLVQ